MTRQREWQKRMREEGRCVGCGGPVEFSSRADAVYRKHCKGCNDKIRERVKNKSGD